MFNCAKPTIVMPALVAGIHAFFEPAAVRQDVDGRNKSGHDVRVA